MKKYKTLLIILLVFLSCLSVYMLYGLANNVYNLCYYAKYPLLNMTSLIIHMVISLLLEIVFIGFSVLGIVTFAKMLKDKQLFITPDEQLASQNNVDTPTNQQ